MFIGVLAISHWSDYTIVDYNDRHQNERTDKFVRALFLQNYSGERPTVFRNQISISIIRNESERRDAKITNLS